MASNHEPSMKMYIGIWIGLIAIMLVEVFLTYQHLAPRMLFACLLVLAIFEAGIGIAYFMHMKYEKPVFLWSVVPITVFVLLLFDHIWPDAFRLAHMSMH
jgi:cytochrome c oxidase subunit IV